MPVRSLECFVEEISELGCPLSCTDRKSPDRSGYKLILACSVVVEYLIIQRIGQARPLGYLYYVGARQTSLVMTCQNSNFRIEQARMDQLIIPHQHTASDVFTAQTNIFAQTNRIVFFIFRF